jgi:hypothetical protein
MSCRSVGRPRFLASVTRYSSRPAKRSVKRVSKSAIAAHDNPYFRGQCGRRRLRRSDEEHAHRAEGLYRRVEFGAGGSLADIHDRDAGGFDQGSRRDKPIRHEVINADRVVMPMSELIAPRFVVNPVARSA